MNRYSWLEGYLLSMPGAVTDYKLEWQWQRYLVGGRMFAAVCTPGPEHAAHAGRTMVILKCDPRLAEAFREQYPEVVPGFYSDKRNWNSVYLDGALPDDVLRDFCADRIQLPFQMLGGLLTVILFAALLEGMQCSTSHAATVRVFDYVCALAAVSLLADPLFQSIAAVQTALEQGASFMTAFVPVFAGILAAGGTAGTAVCYQTGVIALSDGVLQLICHTLLPLCTMGFSLAIVDAVSPSVSVGGLLTLSRKVTTWTLGLLMSVFLGVLSMQNLISGSTDTAAAKTTRYVLSNFVPVVGSAVSDAYATVRGSLQILRSTTGVLGIMALCLLFLPPLLQLLLYRMVVAVGAAAAELFGTQRLLRLLRGTQQALAIAFALLVCFAVMFIVATAVAMTIGKGGV